MREAVLHCCCTWLRAHTSFRGTADLRAEQLPNEFYPRAVWAFMAQIPLRLGKLGLSSLPSSSLSSFLSSFLSNVLACLRGKARWTHSRLLRRDIPKPGTSTAECVPHVEVPHRSLWYQLSKVLTLWITLVLPKFNVHTNHLGILLNCRFWFSKAGQEPEILHFSQTPRGCWCFWWVGSTL